MDTIFFSYSRTDSNFVLKLAKELREAGVNIWLDQLDIAPGSHWDASIQKALQGSKTLLIILSPNSVASENVMDEVSFALEEGKRVIPILKDNCETPFRLRRLQRIDFTTNYTAGFNSLLDALGVAHSEKQEQITPATEPVKKTPAPQPEIKKPAPIQQPSPVSADAPKKSSKKLLMIGGGVLLLALIILGIVKLTGGGSEEEPDIPPFVHIPGTPFDTTSIYLFQHVASGKFLKVHDELDTRNTSIILGDTADYNDISSFEFQLHLANPYVIISLYNKKCLWSNIENRLVQDLNTGDYADAHKFSFSLINNDTFQINDPSGGLGFVLAPDPEHTSPQTDCPVVSIKNDSTANVQWRVIAVTRLLNTETEDQPVASDSN